MLGAGSTAAVFTNESDVNLCSWLPFARSLVRNGVRALLYDYRYTTQHDALTVAREARRTGATRIVLVGASVGARGSLAAAAAAPPAYAAGTDAPQLYRRTAATRKRLVLVPGTAHGVKLLEGAAGARVRRIVTAFIR